MKLRLSALSALVTIPPACRRLEQTFGKPQVVTTLFPRYDFAKRIGGEKAQVSLRLGLEKARLIAPFVARDPSQKGHYGWNAEGLTKGLAALDQRFRETGARKLMPKAAHKRSRDQSTGAVSYLSLREQNLQNLQTGLQ